MSNVYCGNCGTLNNSNNNFCNNCGKALAATVSKKKTRHAVSNEKILINEDNSATKPKNGDNRKIAIFIIIIIILIVYYLSGGNKNKPPYPVTFESPLTEFKENAFAVSKKFVLHNLKAPKSASFPDTDYTCQISDSDSIFTVKSYVDAQNSFSAQIRSNYLVKVKFIKENEDGTCQWGLEDIHIDDNN